MATQLSQGETSRRLATRPGRWALWGVRPTGFWDVAVSELVVGDYLAGSRSVVTAVGSTVSGNRTLTVQRGIEGERTVVARAISRMTVGRE